MIKAKALEGEGRAAYEVRSGSVRVVVSVTSPDPGVGYEPISANDCEAMIAAVRSAVYEFNEALCKSAVGA